MNKIQIKTNFPSLFCISIILLSAFIQHKSFISPNLGWHLHVAQLLLDGKKLYTDITEVNFPFIYYFRIVPVVFSEFTSINVINSAKIVNFTAILISYILSVNIIRNTKYSANIMFRCSLYVSICFGLFILPFMFEVNNFAGKEHLFVAMILPYLLLSFYSKKILKNNKLKIFAIGVIAGLGFCIKPFFAIIFIATELYLAVKNKSYKCWIRPDSLAVIFTGVAGIIFILLVTPDLIASSLSLSFLVYEQYPWYLLPITIFKFTHILLLLFVIFAWNSIKKYEAQQFWAVVLVSAILMAMAGGRGLDYYFYPATFVSIIMLSYTAGDFISEVRKKPLALKSFINAINKNYMEFSATLFFIPYIVVASFLGIANNYTNNTASSAYGLKDLIHVVDKREGSGCLFVFGKLPDAFPMVNYTDKDYCWNNSSQWILAGLESLRQRNQAVNNASEMQSIEKRHMDSVVNVFDNKNPGLVIVNNIKKYTDKDGKKYGYLEYYSKDEHFKEVWSEYHLIEKVRSNNVFSYEIYTRN